MKHIYLFIFSLFISSVLFAQCAVEILPSGDTVVCSGDSVILTAATDGEIVIDQQQLLYLGGESARNLPGYSTWQSFTAGITGALVKIDQGFFNEMTGTATLNIYTGTGFGGTLLYTATVTISGTGNFWETFTISPGVSVTAGSVYTFQLVPDLAGGLPDPYGVQVSGPADAYAGGRCEFDVTWDDVFKTYVAHPLTYTWSTGETDSMIVAEESGIYTVTVSDGLGCTDVDSIEIIVTEINTDVLQTGSSLTAEASGATYQWIDCNDNIAVPSATNQTFTPDESGEYAVVITENGCTDTSDCFTVNINGVGDLQGEVGFSISPNPNNGNFMMYASHEPAEIIIINVLGEVINADIVADGNMFIIDITGTPAGIYFISLRTGELMTTRKIIIQ